jgi:hypothetical protein
MIAIDWYARRKRTQGLAKNLTPALSVGTAKPQGFGF